jgi:glycogen debranching enzyme
VLRAGVTPEGLVASASLPHYAAIWTRDLAFAALGADVSGDSDLVAAVSRSLLSLARVQSPRGQLPVALWPRLGHWDFHEAGCTDATCLFVVAASLHLRAHPDADLAGQLRAPLLRAVDWLADQDANQFTLIDSPSGGDWMDSTLQRCGKLLYVNALYHRALTGMGQVGMDEEGVLEHRAAVLRRNIDLLLWPQEGDEHAALLAGVEGHPAAGAGEAVFPHPVGPAARRDVCRPNRRHYLSHVDGGRYVDECDVLANLLAVLCGIAEPARARRIMEFLDSSPAVHPYPMRTYTRSFRAADRWGMYRDDLERFQDPRWRNPPGRYHNGGVWPFIGALHAVALHRVGMVAEAERAMAAVSAANRLGREPSRTWGFHEWIDANTGEPEGAPGQSWSAGTYLLAAHVLGGGRDPL